MFGKKSWKKEEKKLLNHIFQLQKEWSQLKDILNQSVDPSEIGRLDLRLAEIKYFYLLREAKYYHLNANK
ncbi:YaaL family protein [Amphibacillus indicireducens]|uniref:DUF2508 family protein n=1 Tax=Amphibacillus indicireducens TaxID=1076330 RepID=A0ABP7W3X8_9BACI